MRHAPTRAQLVSRMRQRLLRAGHPRLRMLSLILVTGLVGLVVSTVLLQLGMREMTARYLLALAAAWAVFLLLVRRFAREGDVDVPDLPASAADTPPAPGGTAGDALAPDHGGAGGFGDVGGIDEGALVLIVVLLLALVVAAAVWVIAAAPTLFAELAIDGALSAGLYRRLRRMQAQHWLYTAMRHTAWPFAATALALLLLASAVQYYRPGAHSIGALFAPAPATTATP